MNADASLNAADDPGQEAGPGTNCVPGSGSEDPVSGSEDPVSGSRIAVVLVGPEQASNVGFVARTLACYGIADLRIVGSPGIEGGEAARKTAKGAPSVLASARHFETLASAISDCGFAFGFTRRTREPAQPILDLEEAVAFWHPQPHDLTTALVFGRESQGLFREETLALSHLVRIPMPDEVLSLNLSHAVAIALYAFNAHSQGDPESNSTADADAKAPDGLPSREENGAILRDLLAGLEQRGCFRGGKDAAQREYIRILWQRLQPTRRELDFLAGMLKRLTANS